MSLTGSRVTYTVNHRNPVLCCWSLPVHLTRSLVSNSDPSWDQPHCLLWQLLWISVTETKVPLLIRFELPWCCCSARPVVLILTVPTQVELEWQCWSITARNYSPTQRWLSPPGCGKSQMTDLNHSAVWVVLASATTCCLAGYLRQSYSLGFYSAEQMMSLEQTPVPWEKAAFEAFEVSDSPYSWTYSLVSVKSCLCFQLILCLVIFSHLFLLRFVIDSVSLFCYSGNLWCIPPIVNPLG